jgi:hypothetical protein
MRHTLCALVGVTLVACSTQDLAAAEAGSKWWPFGRRDDANVAQPSAVAPSGAGMLTQPQPNSAAAPLGVAPSAPLAPQSQLPSALAETSPNEDWMFSTPKGKVGWPQLNKPQLPSAFSSRKPAADATRNSWVEQPVTPKPSPLKPITDGAQKVGKSTKAAWQKTVDALTPGESTPSRTSGARIAKRDTQPSFWQRLMGEKEEPQGSQTMPGFIAQQRVDAAPSQTR